jgi:DNA-3-methyladenine glycosylase II
VHRTPILHLKRADAVLARIIDRVGPCRFEPRTTGTHFDALLRSIVYQQLSGKAASTILKRVLAIYGGRYPRPAQLLATPEHVLRTAGLSRQKLKYLRDLAEKVESGDVPLARVGRLADEEVIAHLTRISGIGRWTAQMFLMFRLGRPDVLPELDLGIQNAIQRAYDLPTRPKPADVITIGAAWRPHATIACWYLWRSLETAG